VHPVELDQPDLEILPGRTTAAEVLVVGSDEWAIGDAVSQLHTAGRVAHRCSDSPEAPFPCNALVPGRGCPLDQHEVDVVLDIRTRPTVEPALWEMGAICGLRDGLPLVVAGVSESSAFAPWAERVPQSGDIVSTCDEAFRKQT
jgi:hypothetical protein